MTDHQSIYLKNKLAGALAGGEDYYVFVSRHVDAGRDDPQALSPDHSSTFVDPYRNMILGKRVSPEDSVPCVRNIRYESKVFSPWDDQDEDIWSKDFYAIVQEGSWYHLYKCLDNAGNTVSSAPPLFAHVRGANTNFYRTSDGYKWKYMYSVDEIDYDKFASENFFPVVANATVRSLARDGVIDAVRIENPGRDYGNYLTGEFTSTQIRVGGNTLLYQISSDDVKSSNGFYTGCLLYIKSGGGAGQFETIADYFSNSEGSFVVLAKPFDVAVVNGSQYEINPEVVVSGDGTEKTRARARALVNAETSNSIYEVEMLERGEGYNFARAEVVANVEVGVSRVADLRPVIPPRFGHGFDPCYELAANTVCVRARVSNNELGTVPANNTFNQAGVMELPQFADVLLEITDVSGSFLSGERIVGLKPVKINQGCVLTRDSVVVTCEAGDFALQVRPGEELYLTDNLSNHQLARVSVVENSSSMNLSVNATFSSSNVKMFKNESRVEGVVDVQVNTTHLRCESLLRGLSAGDEIVGESSGAKATVGTVTRAGEEKGFQTFVGLHKYDVDVLSGTFQEDEKVYVGTDLANSTANAVLHSVQVTNTNTWLRTSDQRGAFKSGDTVVGATSLASALINKSYKPEIVFGSGKILFLKNVETVDRSDDSSEEFKFYFEI